MTSAVTVVQENILSFNAEQMALLKTTIAKDASDAELALFVNQCKRTGLDPFTKQIYFIKDKNGKVTICTSVDGLRLIAERTDKYEGQTEPLWCGEDGVWKDVWLDKDKLPQAAKVGVYKQGHKVPTYGIALFKEYAGYNYKNELTYMWNKMPVHMIAKVAEALALRKTFPNDLSALYSTEEISELIENATFREANPPTPTKELLTKDPYVFDGGKYQGKKFSEISQTEFSEELAKYKAVPKITKNLQNLIDRMECYVKEITDLEMKKLDQSLGLGVKNENA